ncbi:MAG: glycoside hydrolase family 16 protein [Chitinophagaceae bacterium]|nr:MAG: glycoside hydrolase family 16 protein [Chitinophagaceae bacterium]
MLRQNRIVFLLALVCLQGCSVQKGNNKEVIDYSAEGYQLVWADEFDKDGTPDIKNWTYEKGFVRNEELQWYQPENAFCKGGMLIIEARKEQRLNPVYVEGSKDWRKNRKNIEYTSASLISKGLQSWQYGRFEMRGKINISAGLWPAFWTLGERGGWPANGEIDIMEYYNGKILANIARMGENRKPKWFSTTKTVNAAWAKQFHVWRMDWDSENISLFVDEELYLKVPLTELQNEGQPGFHPFKQKHYILFDLALGGLNGGDLGETKFPNRMEVDYVRVYQQKR